MTDHFLLYLNINHDQELNILSLVIKNIKAKETQKRFLSVMNVSIVGVPVIGHIKSIGHYIYGDNDAAKDALFSSSRTILVIVCAACDGAVESIIGGFGIDELIGYIVRNIPLQLSD